MKATLIIIQNQADHEAAKALVGKLMQSNEAADRARMVAQARLIEAGSGGAGWGGRDRTSEWRNQNPLPYRLATPQRPEPDAPGRKCAPCEPVSDNAGL